MQVRLFGNQVPQAIILFPLVPAGIHVLADMNKWQV